MQTRVTLKNWLPLESPSGNTPLMQYILFYILYFPRLKSFFKLNNGLQGALGDIAWLLVDRLLILIIGTVICFFV